MQKVGSGVSAAQDSALKTAWDSVMTAAQAGQTDAAEAAFIKVLAQRLAESKPKTG